MANETENRPKNGPAGRTLQAMCHLYLNGVHRHPHLTRHRIYRRPASDNAPQKTLIQERQLRSETQP